MVDLREQLRRQLNFIITSSYAYDAGEPAEAIRIATAARILFHDTGNAQSLIRGHSRITGLRLRSTCSDVTREQGHSLGFIGPELSSGTFRPYLDDVDRDEQIDVDTWWRLEPIMKLFRGDETITRRQLVLAAANKDGGAHVDRDATSEYDRLETGVGMKAGVRLTSGEEKLVTFAFANLAALRQIGHEILTSSELTALLH